MPSLPQRQPALEGGHGVLRRQLGAAAMGEHEACRDDAKMDRARRGTAARRHNSGMSVTVHDPRPSENSKPRSRAATIRRRSVKDEVRQNLIAKLRAGETLFPGIIGYDDTVVPQIVNAILARHNFILLGLRGQAKTRILRALTSLLDEAIPVVPGQRDQRRPAGAALAPTAARRWPPKAIAMPIDWLPREARYVEKLATPDVTIADMIGDIDPIKAAHGGLQLGSELAMHFGLLPRANRGLFAINELPDLAGKIQVGLFNILQEGDVQIKGFPVRLPLDVMVLFTANPEDYTARGKIITPLKDRIGAEIRTHYMASREQAMAITAQEAWVERDQRHRGAASSCARSSRRSPFRRATIARSTSDRASASACRSACSKASSRTPSGARFLHGESPVVPRVHRSLRGAAVDDRQVRARIRRRAEGRRQRRARAGARRRVDRLRRLLPGRRHAVGRRVVRSRRHAQPRRRRRAAEVVSTGARRAGTDRARAARRHRAGCAGAVLAGRGIDFVLEGLYSQKKIGRTDERGYHGTEPVRRREAPQPRTPVLTPDDDDDGWQPRAEEEAVLQLGSGASGQVSGIRRSEIGRMTARIQLYALDSASGRSR